MKRKTLKQADRTNKMASFTLPMETLQALKSLAEAADLPRSTYLRHLIAREKNRHDRKNLIDSVHTLA